MDEASIGNVPKSEQNYNLIYFSYRTDRNTIRSTLDLMIDQSIVPFFS